MAVYRVKWRELAKYMTRQLFWILAVCFIFLMFVRYVSTGFNLDETFEHVKLSYLPLYFIGIYVISFAFAYLISPVFTCAYVTIENNVISGRNYWLLKKRFNLENIETAFLFSSNGMPVVVVNAGKYGEIYIPTHIENSDELFSILDRYVKKA